MTNDDSALMIDYLTEEGLSWVEIEHVLTKLKEHDQRVFRESVFDSIDSGTFNLNAIVEEAKKPR